MRYGSAVHQQECRVVSRRASRVPCFRLTSLSFGFARTACVMNLIAAQTDCAFHTNERMNKSADVLEIATQKVAEVHRDTPGHECLPAATITRRCTFSGSIVFYSEYHRCRGRLRWRDATPSGGTVGRWAGLTGGCEQWLLCNEYMGTCVRA